MPNPFNHSHILYAPHGEEYSCNLRVFRYANEPEQICLRFTDSQDSSPICTITKAFFAPYLRADQIIVDTNNNPGIIATLHDHGIITDYVPNVEIHSGYCVYPVHTLTHDAYMWAQKKLLAHTH